MTTVTKLTADSTLIDYLVSQYGFNAEYELIMCVDPRSNKAWTPSQAPALYDYLKGVRNAFDTIVNRPYFTYKYSINVYDVYAPLSRSYLYIVVDWANHMAEYELTDNLITRRADKCVKEFDSINAVKMYIALMYNVVFN